MGYCTLGELKAYKSIDTDVDDDLLEDLIARATARIDRYCNRTFAGVAVTHYFDARKDIEGRTLFLDTDFLTIESIENGDGVMLSESDYILLPPNTSPKYAVKLKASSGKSWTYVNDPENAITISGSKGYSVTPPDDIIHATVRLARWYYDQRDAPFETVGMPELGTITVPTGIPVDVRDLLDGGYVRRSLDARDVTK